MKSIIAATALTGLASAHSWVHCTDYRGDTSTFEPEQCMGNPRPLDGKVPGMTPFGVDTGFNQQPGATQCHSTDPQHPSYPMANYQRGQQITLAWPAKNHVAAECTNAFIPDTALELFVAPFLSTTATDYDWKQVSASFSDNPHVNGQQDFLGFQNCPRFCENMDKSLCTGTFIVPNDLNDGMYTFQWRWEFNQGTQPYVTCFEAEVKGDFDGTIPMPTPRPTEPEEATPPTAQPENCGGEWSQCGGAGQSYSCCAAGLTCWKKDNWYSQCAKTCPDSTWEGCTGTAPSAPPTTAPPTTAPPTTGPPAVNPTPPPATNDCVSTFSLDGNAKKLKADDATHCWEKCQANKTKNNVECVGWEFVDGDAKPCLLYTAASTTTKGLRNCHPTQGMMQ